MDIEFVVDEYIEKGKLIGDNETVDAILADLTSAKEEIELLKTEGAELLEGQRLRAEAAESALTAERKETERLRELLAVTYHYNCTPYDDVPDKVRRSEFYPQGGSTKKLREAVPDALHPPQQEEQ